MPDMTRREFITLLGGAAASWPLTARAQPAATPVVGFLHSASPGPFASAVVAFRQGLSETGYTEGQNVAIEYRWAEGQYDRLPALAADLVRRQVTVIAAIAGNAPAQAAKAATTSIPIVFVSGGDPVSAGLIASLNRPGGNVTGVSWIATVLVPKQLELLRRLARKPAVIGALVNPSYPDHDFQARELQEAGAALGQKINVVWAATEHDIDTAVVSLVQQGASALLVGADPFFIAYRDHIVALAARHAIPAIYPARDFAVAGGLMSYGTDFTDSYRQAGVYTGRIVRGEKAGDLPVQRSTKFEFVLNFKTAKALGLAVPNSMQLLADEVIE